MVNHAFGLAPHVIGKTGRAAGIVLKRADQRLHLLRRIAKCRHGLCGSGDVKGASAWRRWLPDLQTTSARSNTPWRESDAPTCFETLPNFDQQLPQRALVLSHASQ